MSALARVLLSVLIWPAPHAVRKWLLNCCLGYKIHPTARVGRSIFSARMLQMDEGSQIGALNVILGIELLEMRRNSIIGNLNWIGCIPLKHDAFLKQEHVRCPKLLLGRDSAITNRHYLDCNDLLEVGEFSTLAGVRSSVLTHQIDLGACQQTTAPVRVGRYCFIGSGCQLLAGAGVPDFCVVAAGAVVTKGLTEEYTLYGGVPARAKKGLDPTMGYFVRKEGRVY